MHAWLATTQRKRDGGERSTVSARSAELSLARTRAPPLSPRVADLAAVGYEQERARYDSDVDDLSADGDASESVSSASAAPGADDGDDDDGGGEAILNDEPRDAVDEARRVARRDDRLADEVPVPKHNCDEDVELGDWRLLLKADGVDIGGVEVSAA